MLPISPDIIEGLHRAAFTGEDVFGGFGPDEGFRSGVVLQQVIVTCGLQIVDARVASPTDAPVGDLGEEALYEVHPGRAGWCEVQLEAWMFLEPGHHLGRLVGGVVVEDEVDVAGFQDGPVDVAQEAQELPCAVARHAVADDDARLHVERCEQRGGAVALVVMRHGGRAPLF